jgi:PTS system mannose-specific IIA component
MEGILLLSHGTMAEGMLNTCMMFFGGAVDQVDTLCLRPEDDTDEYEKQIGEKIRKLDTGDGVIVLCDLYAGTPAHKTTKYLNKKVRVIVGMNEPLLLEMLGTRQSENHLDLDAMMEVGRSGLRRWDPAAENSSSEDDFFQ